MEKVFGRFPGETSAFSLIWAALGLSSRGWRGVTMNPRAVAEIGPLRHQPRDTPATTHIEEDETTANEARNPARQSWHHRH